MAATRENPNESILFKDEQAKIHKIKKRWEKDLIKHVEVATSAKDAKEATEIMQRWAWQVVESVLRAEKENKLLERKVQDTTKEAKQWEAEAEKWNVQCDRLKSLCQELQKRNGDIVESSRRMIEEEETKRRNHAESISKTVEDVQKKIEASNEERETQLKNNIELRNQLDRIRNEYGESLDELRRNLEGKVESVKTMETKLSEAYTLAAQWKSQAQKQAELHEQTREREQILSKQIDEYRTKFQEVQSTMNKSTGIIESFQSESKAFSEKLKSTNQENAELHKQMEKLKGKWSRTSLSLIQSNEERKQLLADLDETKREKERLSLQKEKLEKLCRHLAEVSHTPSSDQQQL